MSFDIPPALPAKLKGADEVPGLEQRKRAAGGSSPCFKMLLASGEGDGTSSAQQLREAQLRSIQFQFAPKKNRAAGGSPSETRYRGTGGSPEPAATPQRVARHRCRRNRRNHGCG